jgi:hypothetical protein
VREALEPDGGLYFQVLASTLSVVVSIIRAERVFDKTVEADDGWTDGFCV